MGEYQNLKLVFTYLENGTGNGIINRGLRPRYCKTQRTNSKNLGKMAAKAS